MNPTDLPPSGRDVETHGTPEHCPPPGCHRRSTSIDHRSGLDVRRGPNGIHRKPPRRGQAESRGCPLRFIMQISHSIASSPVSLKVSTTSTRAT